MIAMTEKIFRSGVAHSVETNEHTKNAINPHNTFIENEKPALTDPSIEVAESKTQSRSLVAFEQSEPDKAPDAKGYPSIIDHLDTRTELCESKKHIHDNRQKLKIDNPTDSEKFFESLHRVEERIEAFRQKHPKDNYQSLGDGPRYVDNIQPTDKTSYKDNRQSLGLEKLQDNYQGIGPADTHVDNILYREKKNITSNVQLLKEAGERGTASLSAHESTSDLSDAIEMQANELMSEELSLDDSQLLLNGELSAFDEDELRARVKKMKAKLTRVNQSLKDMEKNK